MDRELILWTWWRRFSEWSVLNAQWHHPLRRIATLLACFGNKAQPGLAVDGHFYSVFTVLW